MSKLHLVLSTHWDREWYQTFQQFRFRLVDLMDRVLDQLSTGELACPFTLDGQVIPIEDYLEIRPEKKELIHSLVKKEKLEVGPWFVMPDIWAVSGESLIRNLELGHRLSQQLGQKEAKALNCCDIFGFHSQMPQIIADFGFETAYIWRGINLTENRYFNWQGADGTILPTYRFGVNGYWAYGVQARNAVNWDHKMSLDGLKENLMRFIKTEQDRSETDQLLAFDSLDHSYVDEPLYKLYEELKHKGAMGENELIFGTLESFAQAFLQDKNEITQTYTGELLNPSLYNEEEHALIPDPISSRTWIKQQNSYCETLLTRLSEPLSALAQKLGRRDDTPFINLAWKKLITNHPHDSICGTSIDDVHRDMAFRFKECKEIGEKIVQECLAYISAVQTDLSQQKEGAMALNLYNPAEYDHFGPLKITLELPCDYYKFEARRASSIPGFNIKDNQGKELDFVITKVTKNQNTYSQHPWKSVKFFKTHRVELYLDCDLPSLGLAQFILTPRAEVLPLKCIAPAYGINTGKNSMENEFLTVNISAAGEVTLYNKLTRREYPGIFTLESEREEGSPFYHITPPGNTREICLPSLVEIRTNSVGDLACEMTLRYKSSLYHGAAQGEIATELTLILEKGSPALKAELKINNKVDHHRLRVLFPTFCSSDFYFSNSPFDVVKRSIAPRPELDRSLEVEPETRPQESWSTISSEQHGFGVAAPGLKEAALLNRKDRALAITLFRSYSKFKFRNGENDSLELGEHSYCFAVVPSEGFIKENLSSELVNELNKQSILLNTGIVVHGQHRWEQDAIKSITSVKIEEPISQSVKITGARLSCLRKRESALEVRIYNDSSQESSVEVRLNKPYVYANMEKTDLKGIGKPMTGVWKNNLYKGTLGAGKIETLWFFN